ncbi:uncharacterized protein LOC144773842 [Lissotriton helveticus]
MESQEAQRDAAERKRKQKFSQEELQVLISEVVRHYGKIFGKQTLHVAESIKRSTWLDIQGKVNAIGVTHRDLEDLKKRWYDIRIITKKKLAAHRKESAATGGGRNRAPRLTDIEEMVATTLEKECIHGIGDADSSARGAKKPGESKRSTAEVREKRREGAGPSTSHGGQDQEQAAPIPEEATAEYPQSPLLFGSQDTGAAELSPTPTSPSPVLGRVRSHDVPPRRILQTSSEEEEVEVLTRSPLTFWPPASILNDLFAASDASNSPCSIFCISRRMTNIGDGPDSSKSKFTAELTNVPRMLMHDLPPIILRPPGSTFLE